MSWLSGSDYEFWIDDIVREAEGRMLDGVSPGEILAAVVMELRDKRALTYAADKVMTGSTYLGS